MDEDVGRIILSGVDLKRAMRVVIYDGVEIGRVYPALTNRWAITDMEGARTFGCDTYDSDFHAARALVRAVKAERAK